jgi:hypothetical protein
MHAFILQDWNTIRGATSVTTVIQSEDNWLDLTPYQDVMFWVDCRALTGTTVQIQFQTSPTKDDTLFTAIVAATTFTASAVQVYQVILSKTTGSQVPLARYVRWVVTSAVGSGVTWDATFRVLVAANSPGM